MRGDSSTDLTQRQEIFVEVQKAYGYLTNPLTKAIYDEFGVSGLAVYEKSKPKFRSLQEEIRGIDSREEAERRDESAIARATREEKNVEKKRQIKQKIIKE